MSADLGITEQVTVAFSIEALEQVRSPARVMDQTKGWARSVGLVSDRPMHAQTGFARTHGFDYSFHSGPRDLLESLPSIMGQPEHRADRYLLIGANQPPDTIEQLGWAYLPIEEAARAADWTLAENDEDDRGWP